MLAILILASVALVCQSTPDYYKPAFYRQPAPVYLAPAPIRYEPPIAIKEAPKPYSFGYNAPAIGGGSSRHESSDGNGRVVGSYTVVDADGRARVVDYYADETGFHANVKTNEPGTANQNPADVSVESYAAPAVSPVVSPKVIAAPARYIAPRYTAPRYAAPRYTAPAPIYRVAAPVRPLHRSVAVPHPVSYRIVPSYEYSPAYSPVSYGNYYGSHSPYDLGYYK